MTSEYASLKRLANSVSDGLASDESDLAASSTDGFGVHPEHMLMIQVKTIWAVFILRRQGVEAYHSNSTLYKVLLEALEFAAPSSSQPNAQHFGHKTEILAKILHSPSPCMPSIRVFCIERSWIRRVVVV